MLAYAADAPLVLEPDNQLMFPGAMRAKRAIGKGFYPRLVPGDEEPGFLRLWEYAYGLHGVGRTPIQRARAERAARVPFRSLGTDGIRACFFEPPRESAFGLMSARSLVCPRRQVTRTILSLSNRYTLRSVSSGWLQSSTREW